MSRQQISSWPFLLVLAGLFVLSVAAPRGWQKISHHPAPPAATKARRAAARAAPRPRAAETVAMRPEPRRPLERSEPVGKVLSEVKTPPAAGPPAIEAGPAIEPQPERLKSPSGPPAAPEQPKTLVAVRERAKPGPLDLTAPPGSRSATSSPQSAPGGVAAKRGRTARKNLPAAAQAASKFWQFPEVLMANLDRLALDCEASEWATRTGDLIRELSRLEGPQAARSAEILAELQTLAASDHALERPLADNRSAAAWRRIHHALVRYVEIWRLTPELARTCGAVGKPTAALDRELHHWTAEPADPRQLLSVLERFEQSGSPGDARALARCVHQIADWPGPAAEQAQAWLDTNYRNSNLRVSISAEFLNRLTPRPPPIEAPVRDRILGVPTRGWSTTTADLGIRLIPDPQRVHLALEVQGQVSARTTSRSGPATFYSQSDGEYLARKEVAIGLAGLHMQPAEADASSSPRLQGVETDYDDVPLLGLVIEGVARAKHAEQEGAVRRISRQRVAARVQEELDAAVESKLKLANEQFQLRVLKPLKDLSLEPAVVGMQTSERRLTLRLRLAADEQLAACTPRPQALSDSLASVQIHQSLVNNVCERLRLDGAAFALPDLQRHLAKTLGLDAAKFSADYPHDMQIKFAPRDAVRVRFISGRVQITLAIAELRKYPTVWRDFQVRVHYKPWRRGLDLRFVRDGTVQLWGERFGAQPQIALRGIFSRAFSQDRELRLLEPRPLRDPRLAGLEFTQCVLTDGWLGLSIGPRRPAPRTASR